MTAPGIFVRDALGGVVAWARLFLDDHGALVADVFVPRGAASMHIVGHNGPGNPILLRPEWTGGVLRGAVNPKTQAQGLAQVVPIVIP